MAFRRGSGFFDDPFENDPFFNNGRAGRSESRGGRRGSGDPFRAMEERMVRRGWVGMGEGGVEGRGGKGGEKSVVSQNR